MSQSIDIHKSGGILIRDRKLLVERSYGKEFFIAPGGSLEPGETAQAALIRELMEEFAVEVLEENLEPFGTFYANAAGQINKRLRMDVFVVTQWSGVPTPSSEVEEIHWINSMSAKNLKLGSIFEHEVIPRLITAGLID